MAELNVSQRARDAAADMWASIGRAHYADFQQEWMRDGTADYGPVVQAFASFEAALSTRPATSPITGEAREAIAQPIINAFWHITNCDSATFDKYVDEAISAILAALPLAPREGWQEIASAPKDGTRILVWIPNCKDAVVGNWDEHRHRQTPKPYWTNTLERTFGVAWCRANPPSHWMPLPAAPAALSRTGEVSRG